MDLLAQTGVMSTLTQIRDVEVNGSVFAKLLPLWRLIIWALAVFVLLIAAAVVRMDVQRLQMDFDRNDRLSREATLTNERLRMELDVRKRLGAVQGYADSAELVHLPAHVIVESGK